MNPKISFTEFSRLNDHEVFSINHKLFKEFYIFATLFNEEKIRENKPEIDIDLILQVFLYKKSQELPKNE